MLNFITQQRRGTTEEWAVSTVIPRAGEFVIEECKNAPNRVKIGDGVHLFKDLKYLDEDTVALLTALEARFNTHVAYVEGSEPIPDSTLATEVVDARFIDGTSYSCLNEAIQSVSDKRIGGMVYDYEGLLGIKQPYMLYLTDKDNNIIEETGVRIISGAGGGGGGASGSSLKIGYITTSPLIVTPTDSAILKFTFNGTDSSGDTILQASATWKVDGTTVNYGVVKDGENEFDVTRYLKLGTTKVLLTVVDDSGGVVTKTWSVQQVDVRVESNFDDKITYPIDSVIFDYIPHGAVDKTIYFVLDGKLLGTVESSAKISGNSVNYELPKQEHGAHLLDVYIEANINNNLVTSNHVLKDILWYDPKNNKPVIGTIHQNFTAKQYDITNIEYTVYDPSSENPEVIIAVDDVEVSRVVMNNPTNTFAYTTTDIGQHIITLTCGSTVKTITANIEKLDIDVSPVTVGLAFDFNPTGRSNDDLNRLWSYDDITMSVSDNFDWVNGGYKQDSDGSTYFCVKSGTTATINYNLFEDDAKRTGKEMKLVFKTANVANPEAIFLSCLDNTTDKDHIGLQMSAHLANIHGQNGKLDLEYSEDDLIEFEFNITRYTETIPMIVGYEDGVSTRHAVYDSSFSFKQNTPKPIVIGCDDCDVHIYRMKVYSTSLTPVDILNNFIADARTSEEMRSRYERNQIYDENQNLTAEVLAEKCPWLYVYKLSAPHFTNNKSDKVKNTTIQQILKGGDPVLDNWIAHNAQHSGQGTSSNNYGAAGRNLDFIMNKSDCYFELGDGSTTDADGNPITNITLTRTSVPVAYLNAKVNIASSNNLTNALLAKRYNEFNPYRRPFVREDESSIEYIKDTMEFHNCVIFIQETDPDLSTHREFADTDWHFYAIGNIGDSKKTDNTRLTDMNDPYECCIEIMDVGLPLSAFPRDTMINAMGYKVDEKTEEKIYTWATDDNLDILYERADDGSYYLTSDSSVDYTKTYYVDILEQDDFSEDYTYGWRYISDEDDSSVVDYCKQKWIEFYRFVTNSTDEEFKNNLHNYFVVDSALYYYLFTTRYCMVDNRAKNTFWHYGKSPDGTRKWDLCWDYDNDTSLGLNNYGKQVYRYGLEDIDKDEAGEEVFRQSNSLFFCRIRDLFASELKAMYKDLESSNAWKAETLINDADNWQNQFPEELWRLDIERKYIRTYTSSFINGKGDAQFLVNMANGKMKYHRRQWERSQEQYMASKFQTTTASGDNYHANFRMGEPDTDTPVIPANYQFTITPYSYIYLNVWYGDVTRTPYSVRAVPNVPTTVPCPSSLEADIVNVGSAAAIRDFGDLSAMYPKTASVSNASRLKKLVLGNSTEGYRNTMFTTLTTGSNPLLTELNVENITSLTQSLDLRKLINLKTVYAFGTNITSVMFAEGGKIELAQLPALNSLTLKNLLYLRTDKLMLESHDNVIDLTVDGCPLIDAMYLRSLCKNLRRARLIDVEIPNATYEFFRDNLFNLKGLNSSGEETENAWITGTAYFESLTGTQMSELNRRYPNLDIRYQLLTCHVQFKESPESDVILHQETIKSTNNILVDCLDPVSIGLVTTPVKEQTDANTFTYAGWSEVADGIPVDPSPLVKVKKDLVLYPTFDAHVRQYTIRFFNNDNSFLNSYQVDYGTPEFIYPAETPKKANVNNAEEYLFNKWIPEPKNIISNLDCYATYTLDPTAIYDVQLSDLEYTINKDNRTLSILNYNNTVNKLIRIQDSYIIEDEEYTVTSIEGSNLTDMSIRGFRDANLEYVILPQYLTRIGNYAFYANRNITTITIPETVTELCIGAFAECTGLTDVYYNAVSTKVNKIQSGDPPVFYNTFSRYGYTVHIGDKVETIPSNVFTQTSDPLDNMFAAKIVEFGTTSVCKTIESYAFNKTRCVEVNLPTSLITIGSYAFDYSYLEEVIIPSNVTTIGEYAFAHCSTLSYVYIPVSVTSIHSRAFCNSWNFEFDIQAGSIFLWINHCLINTKTNTLLMGRADSVIPADIGIQTLAEHCFVDVAITSIVIPEGVTIISPYAFYHCAELCHIELPTTLIKLDSFALYGCSWEEIALPMNLQTIGTFALVDNPNLKSITLPSSLRSIGYRSLRGCTNLQSVKFETNNLVIAKPQDAYYDLFTGDTKLNYIEVNWASDGSTESSGGYPFANINEDAPWFAGTDSLSNKVASVTVKYTDKTLVYNTNGTIEDMNE